MDFFGGGRDSPDTPKGESSSGFMGAAKSAAGGGVKGAMTDWKQSSGEGMSERAKGAAIGGAKGAAGTLKGYAPQMGGGSGENSSGFMGVAKTAASGGASGAMSSWKDGSADGMADRAKNAAVGGVRGAAGSLGGSYGKNSNQSADPNSSGFSGAAKTAANEGADGAMNAWKDGSTSGLGDQAKGAALGGAKGAAGNVKSYASQSVGQYLPSDGDNQHTNEGFSDSVARGGVVTKEPPPYGSPNQQKGTGGGSYPSGKGEGDRDWSSGLCGCFEDCCSSKARQSKVASHGP